MKKTNLIFRSVGERTSALSLELAIENIKPNHVDVIRDVKPFTKAVEHQRSLQHDADQVVCVDADCLILDDMVPFLQNNSRPYVDCFVNDHFRGNIHCGVHITRIDVVRAMSRGTPPVNDKKYVLRPESRLRNIALKNLDKRKEFRNFNILHDHFQFYRDIFAKYALRDLRSRTNLQRRRLRDATEMWSEASDDRDIFVAQLGIEHARRSVPINASPRTLAKYIERLPTIASEELRRQGIVEKPEMTRAELDDWLEKNPQPSYGVDDRHRVFGIGLSRTATRSLTMALHVLGWDTIHYPADAQTFEELVEANYRFSVLDEYHGITDITVAPFYAQLDSLYPGSKFVLTVRDLEPWLRSCTNHWEGRSAFAPAETAEQQVYMKTRRLLRAAVFGCYYFDAERFAWVYKQHISNVARYFQNRPEDLLVLDVCGGDGWDELCRFLDTPRPTQPFPHKGSMLKKLHDQQSANIDESAVVSGMSQLGKIGRERVEDRRLVDAPTRATVPST